MRCRSLTMKSGFGFLSVLVLVMLLYISGGLSESVHEERDEQHVQTGHATHAHEEADDKPHLHGRYEYLWMPPYDPQPSPTDVTINGKAGALYNLNADASNGYLRRVLIRQRLDADVDAWLQAFRAFYAMSNVEPGEDEYASEGYYHKHCLADPDFFRMYADPMCTYLWMRRIRSSEVVRAEDLVPVIPDDELADHPGFKKSANGGMRCRHANGDRSYWKPCHGNGASTETYYSEIVYFFIDRFLGLYRTPPAVLKFFSADKLRALASDTSNEYHDDEWPWMVESINAHCGDVHGTEGALVGWTNFPIEELEHDIKTDHIYAGKDEDVDVFAVQVNVTQNTNHVELVKALDTISFYVHESLCGYTGKWGHNIFISYKADHEQFGPICNIDNDRCQWSKSTPRLKKSDIEAGAAAFSKACRFPENVALRILHLAPDPADVGKRTLGSVVREAAQIYQDTKSGSLLHSSEAEVIDENIGIFANLIRDCIAEHGEEYVMVKEPWYQTYNTFQLNVPISGAV